VLIAATDIGRDDLEKNAVIDLPAARALQLWKVNRLNFDFTRSAIDHPPITWP
jgi:hypothetical protein